MVGGKAGDSILMPTILASCLPKPLFFLSYGLKNRPEAYTEGALGLATLGL